MLRKEPERALQTSHLQLDMKTAQRMPLLLRNAYSKVRAATKKPNLRAREVSSESYLMA
jgi:hypothetical protein